MAEHKQPKSVAVPNVAGYPNDVAKTQTVKTRGTGAATKATKHSKKMG
jgi:hypothetical protein